MPSAKSCWLRARRIASCWMPNVRRGGLRESDRNPSRSSARRRRIPRRAARNDRPGNRARTAVVTQSATVSRRRLAAGVHAARSSTSRWKSTFRSYASARAAVCTRWREMTSWLTLFFASALLLPPLPISLGNSGPHLCLVFAAFGFLFGVVSLTHWRIAPSGLNAAFTAFFGVLFASVAIAALHSGRKRRRQLCARRAAGHLDLYLLLHRVRSGPHADPHRAVTPHLYAFAAHLRPLRLRRFLLSVSRARRLWGRSSCGSDSGVYRRAQGLFYEASTLGNFCAFFLVMIAVAFSRRAPNRRSRARRLLAGGALFFAALVLSLFARSLINIAVACAVLVWHQPAARAAGHASWCVLGVATSGRRARSPGRSSLRSPQCTGCAFQGPAEYFFSETAGVLSGRVESWRTAAAWIHANPWQAALRHRL